MNQLEPFIELLNRKHSLKFKHMRFTGRLPFQRRKYSSSIAGSNAELKNFDKSITSIISELNDKGYSGKLQLDRDKCDAILSDLEGEIFVDRADRSLHQYFNFDNPINNLGGHIYSNFEAHVKSDTLRNLIDDDIQPVASAYLGAKCRFMNSQVWITFPQQTQSYNADFGWHYDVDDYKFIKFFCYLNDVDGTNGPHAILPSSHKSRHVYRFFNRRISENQAGNFGQGLVLTGPKGTCFFEDTIIYHKGSAPISGHRIILQVQFNVSSEFYNS